jgi:citrate lyase gamma subunit
MTKPLTARQLASDELAITVTPLPACPITLSVLAEVADGFGDMLREISRVLDSPDLRWIVRRIRLDAAGALTIVAGAGELAMEDETA